MRRLVIHAGIHRTGTTTLQRTLASSRELLMQSGYCYPGRKEHHQELVFAIKRKEMSDQAVFNYITQDCGDAHTIIISGEDFCTLTDLSFLSHLKKYFEVEAHIVLRRQDDWLMSWYNQHVRWPHAPNKYKMTPEQFLRTLPDYAWLYFDDLGLRWRRHLGAENLHFRIMKGNTAEAFLRTVLPDVDIRLLPRDNDSVSPAALEILRNLDMMPLRDGHRIHLIQAAVRSAGQSSEKYIYSVSQRREILRQFAESNRRTARLFFHRDELFEPTLPENDDQLFEGMSKGELALHMSRVIMEIIKKVR